MKDGIGIFIWKLSVALYLIANGALAFVTRNRSDFQIISNSLKLPDNVAGVLVPVLAVIALIAGIAILLEMFNVSLPFLSLLILIVAIIWAVYIVVNIISFFTDGMNLPWVFLQRLAVHTMVFGSLLVASKRFG